MGTLSRKVHRCASSAVLCALVTSCVIEIPLEPNEVAVQLSSIDLHEFVQRTNDVRVSAGLAALNWSDALSRAAVLHARQMADAGIMAHEFPEGEFPTLSSRVYAFGYDYAWVSENIAYGYPSVRRVMSVWMASEVHRDNILDPAVTEIGMGAAVTRSGTPYYVNVYARRR